MPASFFEQSKFHFLLIGIFAGAVMLPSLAGGMTSGNDFQQHYQFAVTIYEAIANGRLFPGWADTTNFGFGDVGVRFYPPLSYYVLALFRWFTGNWFAASYCAFTLWFYLGGLGVYLWSRRWFSTNASLIAALVYTFAPYHVNEIYNAFTYAEFAASGILPFCFLFVDKIWDERRIGNLTGLAAAYAALVLTHIPMTVIGSIAILMYIAALFYIDRKKPKFSLRSEFIRVFDLICGIALALLASAFYWVRMVSELNFVKASTSAFSSNEYDYRNNFLLSYFTVSPEVYARQSLWHCDWMLGITLLASFPCVVYYLLCRRTEIGRHLHFVTLLAGAIFFSVSASSFLWRNFQPLEKIQFPWRWLAITSLASALLAASAFDVFKTRVGRKARPMLIGFSVLIMTGLLFTVIQVIMPAQYLDRQSFDRKLAGIASVESFQCWWPLWANAEALNDRALARSGNRETTVVEWKPEIRRFTVDTGEDQRLRVATFYYPNWKAEVDGKVVTVERDESGIISIPIGTSKTQVTLYFEEPLVNSAAAYISLATLLGLASIFAITGVRTNMKKRALLL